MALFGLPSVGTLARAARRRVGFGWVKDPAHSTQYHEFDRLGLAAASGDVSIQAFCGPVLDQLSTNSCVANALLDAERTTLYARHGLRDAALGSRLFAYSLGRHLDGWHRKDLGSRPMSVLAALVQHGIPPERMWPFVPLKVNMLPPLSARMDATDRRGIRGTYKIYDLGDRRIEAIRAALAAHRALAFGVAVDEAFTHSEGPDHVEWSRRGTKIGQHMMEVVALKYERDRYWVLVKNSWGPNWRAGGYCWLDEGYILNGFDWIVVDPREPAR